MTTKTTSKQNGRGDSINNINSSVLNISTINNEDRIYTYAEAINLAGKYFYHSIKLNNPFGNYSKVEVERSIYHDIYKIERNP